ncbi:VOC family protein [Rhodopirellula sp. SWK7]|uniref:VOC family protein n=1 Tax=Rhodopirellula sp. SWK7 TaxID=595460 RepID=UPI0002BDED3D|nr:VOC family protein [Rhodopirellula sp. SWK7]EMI41372.1 glyoxalase/bleomycin resistance protein/dioxygenase [Rhodopirellula sp. SWK7]
MNSNPIVWFEIYVDDLARATTFYETVLDIKLEELPAPVEHLKMMAFPASMESPGASGALCKMEGMKCGTGAGTIVYFRCEDCGVESSRTTDAGGKIQMPKSPIGQYGFISLGVDTEGNVFGLHSQK